MRRIAKVMVVGEAQGTLRAVSEVARTASVEVVACRHPDNAWALAMRPEVILVVWSADLLRIADLQGVSPEARGQMASIVVVGDQPTTDNVIEAFRAGVIDYVMRPLSETELVAALMRCSAYRKRVGNCLATRLDDYVERGYVDPGLSMASIARHFGVSSGYVGRLFREELGMSLRMRLKQERVKRAKDLLKNTDEPMYAIAEACGFRSPSRFSEGFSAVVGMAPMSFRHSMRSAMHGRLFGRKRDAG